MPENASRSAASVTLQLRNILPDLLPQLRQEIVEDVGGAEKDGDGRS